MASDGISLGSPKTIEREIKWHRLHDDSVVNQLRRAGKIACMPPDSAINHAMFSPPDNTRACLRSKVIKSRISDNAIKEIDWYKWKVFEKEVRADNVYSY
jgi:hypothetical protein